MKRALGVTEFMAKKFSELDFDGKWEQAMGRPENNFKAIIYGKPKNGKTEFCIQLAKYLTRFGKVLYNSFEQGHSKSLQDAFRRQNMQEVSGKILITHKERFKKMFERLEKKKSPQIVFIDSLQYIKLSSEQWKEMIEAFPRKIFIAISHAQGEDPRGASALEIQHDVDISIHVKGFCATCQGRFGGGDELIIWEEGHQRYLKRIAKHKGKEPAALAAAPQPDLFSNNSDNNQTVSI